MTPCQNSAVAISLATSPWDYLFARQLRNKNIQNMTNNRSYITIWVQIKFYLNNHNNIKLYIATVGGRRAAYLLLREKDNFCFITEVVEEKYQKKGVALAMIKFAQSFNHILIADILKTNLASINLHIKSGFIKTFDDHALVRYQYCQSKIVC